MSELRLSLPSLCTDVVTILCRDLARTGACSSRVLLSKERGVVVLDCCEDTAFVTLRGEVLLCDESTTDKLARISLGLLALVFGPIPFEPAVADIELMVVEIGGWDCERAAMCSSLLRRIALSLCLIVEASESSESESSESSSSVSPIEGAEILSGVVERVDVDVSALVEGIAGSPSSSSSLEGPWFLSEPFARIWLSGLLRRLDKMPPT